ncbi:MAG: hypothetical protein K6E22_09120 [Treponema sp.]|nr:hypothetical protein [Treponema sp.]
MFSKDNTEIARKKFFDHFKEMTGKKVLSVEFATLTAYRRVFEAFELEPPPGQNELAGLLVFCGDALYFYVFPTDNILRLAIQRMAGDMDNKEQCFCLSNLSDTKLSNSKRKSFRFLFPKQSRTIYVSAKYKEEAADFSLSLMKDASSLLEKISALLPHSAQISV